MECENLYFSSWKDKERKGDKIQRDINPGQLALANNNQKLTWSVTLIDGLSKNCTFQQMRMQTWGSCILEEFGGTVSNGEAMSRGRGSRRKHIDG